MAGYMHHYFSKIQFIWCSKNLICSLNTLYLNKDSVLQRGKEKLRLSITYVILKIITVIGLQNLFNST